MDAEIKKWKELYKDVFKITIRDETFIYRTLNVGEAINAVKAIQLNDGKGLQDAALKAVLHPLSFSYDGNPFAGDVLIEKIVESSPICSRDGCKELIKQSHINVNSFYHDIMHWQLGVMMVFPGYTLDVLSNMRPDKFFELLVVAEKVSGKPIINYNKLGMNQKNVANAKKRDHTPQHTETKLPEHTKLTHQQIIDAAIKASEDDLRHHMRE